MARRNADRSSSAALAIRNEDVMEKLNVLMAALAAALNGSLGKQIATEVAAKNKSDSATKTVVEGLISVGLHAADLRSPGKDGTEAAKEQYAKVKEMLIPRIVAGWSKADQTLFNLQTKAVPEDKKAQRKYLQQQIGSAIGRYARGMQKVEDANAPEAAPKTPQTFEAATIEKLSQMKAAAQKVDAVWSKPEFDKLINAVIDFLSK